jgi:hypothetical protein
MKIYFLQRTSFCKTPNFLLSAVIMTRNLKHIKYETVRPCEESDRCRTCRTHSQRSSIREEIQGRYYPLLNAHLTHVCHCAQVIVIIPEVPGFAGDVKGESSIKTIMAAQYRTINRGGSSIYEEIRRAGFEP